MIQALLERLKREGLTYLVDQENNKRQTPLFLAVAVNEPQKVQLLVNAGANVNTLAQVSTSLLHCINYLSSLMVFITLNNQNIFLT